jgi:hypothetical protein
MIDLQEFFKYVPNLIASTLGLFLPKIIGRKGRKAVNDIRYEQLIEYWKGQDPTFSLMITDQYKAKVFYQETGIRILPSRITQYLGLQQKINMAWSIIKELERNSFIYKPNNGEDISIRITTGHKIAFCLFWVIEIIFIGLMVLINCFYVKNNLQGDLPFVMLVFLSNVILFSLISFFFSANILPHWQAKIALKRFAQATKTNNGA